MTIKLLVARNDEHQALGLCVQVAAAVEGCRGEATQIAGTVQRAAVMQPDVLILEYTDAAPEFAWHVLEQIGQVSASTRPLMLCDTYTPRSIVGFIQRGASGCMLSTIELPLCAKAVRVVQRGESWFGRTELLHALHSQMDADPLVSSNVLEDQEMLTAREREILGLVGSAMSNREIARQLNISDHTVKTHLHHIYVKLEKSGRYKAFLSKTVAAPPSRPGCNLAMSSSHNGT
jgi:DNA-binding NarL/FixJ family response regulator